MSRFLPLASCFLHPPTPIKELGANPPVEEVRGQVIKLALPAIVEQLLILQRWIVMAISLTTS